MPLVRIDLRKGKDAAYLQEVGRVVYEALLSVGVPENDRFQIIGEHEAGNFLFDPNYLGIHRGDDLVIIQITWNEGRTVEQKKRSTNPSQMDCRQQLAFGQRTSSSTWSRSGKRIGHSATAWPSTRHELRTCRPQTIHFAGFACDEFAVLQTTISTDMPIERPRSRSARP